MKSILAFVGGGDRDAVILRTALAAARPVDGWIDCLHAHVPAAMAARYGHTEFARGAVIRDALEQLGEESDLFSRAAAANVRVFCESAGVPLCDARPATPGVAVGFREDASNDRERLAMHAAASDLVVIGRARQRQGLPPDTLEHLARVCGKPLLVAASDAAESLTETVLVCWKDESSAAAVQAAAPLLRKARRVVFAGVATDPKLLRQAALQYGGEHAEAIDVQGSQGNAADVLAHTADELGACLVVMGAYGRSRTREMLFGSHTDAMLDKSDKPILLLHAG